MKKFLASLLGVVIFFLLVPTSVILVARDITNEKTIEKIIEAVPEILGEEYEEYGFGELFIKEIEEGVPEITGYFDEKRIEEEAAKLIANMLRNTIDPNAEVLIDATGFKEYFEEVIEQYEKETNEDVRDDFIESIFDNFNEQDLYTKEEFENDMGEMIILFKAVYSNEILITLITVIVLCIVLMFILLRDISTTLLKAKTPFMVNGILIVLIGSGVSTMLKSIEMNSGPIPSDFIGIITNPFYKIGIASIAISIVLIILSKVLKHNKSISNSNAALENLGNVNYIPNNNITNTPYNGYQNH